MTAPLEPSVAARLAADVVDEAASEWEEAMNEKSDRWKDGGAGQAAQERIGLVRGWFDELPGDGEPPIDGRALT